MKDKVGKYMLVSLFCNLFLCIIKIIFGIIGSMKSLVADGIHSFSDLSTDLIAIIGNKLSKKPADDGHPRGHGKIEYITGLIISCFIIMLSFSILKDSLTTRLNIPNMYLSIVIIITIIVKYLLSYFLIRKGKKINSMILISSGKESYTDVYSSILVLVVLILSQFYDRFTILKYSDIIGSILISILIFIMGFRLLLANLSLLVGESERSIEKVDKVKQIIKNRKEEFILEEITMLKLGSYYEVILKILVDGNMTVKEGHDLMDNIENDLLSCNLKIEFVTIHIEPNNN